MSAVEDDSGQFFNSRRSNLDPEAEEATGRLIELL
jgi:hypothetical protein